MLALVAGKGALPARIAAEAGPVLVCAMEGAPPDSLVPDLTFRVEKLGGFIAELRRRGVTRVCMAGAVPRPAFDPLALDFRTLLILPRLLRGLRKGDDGTLREAIRVFERAGLEVVAAHDLLRDLVLDPGTLTRRKPDAGAMRDAERAERILDAMSVADVGQAVVVSGGQALAIEAAPGTDRMLATLASEQAQSSPIPHGPNPGGAERAGKVGSGGGGGGILFKAPKTGQDRRVDLPAIGPETVAGARRAGLDGLVVEAGGVMVLDAARVISDCDAAGMFLWSRSKGSADAGDASDARASGSEREAVGTSGE